MNPHQLLTPCLTLIAAALAALPALAAGRIDLVATDLLGTNGSFSGGLSAAGAAGTYYLTPANDPFVRYHAYQYSDGVMSDLGTLGGLRSRANAVNDSGQVVGWSNTASGASHAFLFASGVMTDLGTLGGANSQANAINNLGQVVGQTATAAGLSQAFVYSNGVMNVIGIPGAATSTAWGVNDSGAVVGVVQQQAFVYRNGVMSAVGSLGGTLGTAFAINASGQIVGTSATALGDFHAFVANGGAPQDPGTLGGTASTAYATNDSGQIVGTATRKDGTTGATLWNTGTIHDLNALAPAGWLLDRADGINRNGQITGDGTHNGQRQAFVLTLHPDWQGGSGSWNDPSHWNYAGLGDFGIVPGAPHDVVIAPLTSASIRGPLSVTIRSLTMGAANGQFAVLDLQGGTIDARQGTLLQAGAVLSGSGMLVGGLVVRSGALVQVGPGQALQLAGAPVSHAGAMRILGTADAPATLRVGGPMATGAGSQIEAQNAVLDFSGGIDHNGQLNLSYGNSNLSGPLRVTASGQIIVSGNSAAAFYDSVDVKTGGELRISGGSSATFFGAVLQRTGALFTGTGSKFYEGGLSVGASPGLGVDSGDVRFGDGNVYVAEIGGLTACTVDCASNDALRNSSFDKYVVAGHLRLGGTLKLASWNGFTLQAAQTIDLFDAGSLDGTFASVDASGLLLVPGLAVDTSALLTDGSIRIAAVPEPRAWSLMLVGLAWLGCPGLARHRKRSSSG